MSGVGIAEIALIDAADMRAALDRALHIDCRPEPSGGALKTCSAAIDAAARAQIKRLADPGIADMAETQRRLNAVVRHTRLLLEALEADLTVPDEIVPVVRVTDVKTQPTASTSAIESGARAAGYDDPVKALNDALREVANLHVWAEAGARSFADGHRAREAAGRGSPEVSARRSPIGAAVLALADDNSFFGADGTADGRRRAMPAHAGRELGLVVLTTYAELTGRPVSVSRRSNTKSREGGKVTGPLDRFQLAVFESIRRRMVQEPTLKAFSKARAFNPTGATIAAWAREYRSIR